MFNPTNHPILILVLSPAVFWLAGKAGEWIHAKQAYGKNENHEDFTQRKIYEELEANAIGTEYVRADFLPAVDAARVRSLLSSYLDQRILWYKSGPNEEPQINAHTTRLQSEMWAAVRQPVAAQPTPVAAVVASGLNDVLNSQGYTEAMWWNRIPEAAWMLLIFVAIFCNMLIGFGARVEVHIFF